MEHAFAVRCRRIVPDSEKTSTREKRAIGAPVLSMRCWKTISIPEKGQQIVR